MEDSFYQKARSVPRFLNFIVALFLILNGLLGLGLLKWLHL